MQLLSIYERPDRYEVLYELLRERDGTINISHRELPAWDAHQKFIDSKPYAGWFFILVAEEVVGACYLTKHDEIGVFIFKKYQGKGYGRQAVELLMAQFGAVEYVANINPRNERSIELFKRLGFNLVQHTYARSR